MRNIWDINSSRYDNTFLVTSQAVIRFVQQAHQSLYRGRGVFLVRPTNYTRTGAKNNTGTYGGVQDHVFLIRVAVNLNQYMFFSFYNDSVA